LDHNFHLVTSPHLQNAIHSIWQTDGATTYKEEAILPKGIVEIIFDLGSSNPIHAIINDDKKQLSKYFINGFNTTSINIQLPAHQAFLGVRLHPAAVKNVTDVPAKEFVNANIDLMLIKPMFNTLWHQLLHCKTFSQRVTLITDVFSASLIELTPREKLLNNFLSDHNSFIPSVKELAKALCYTPRHLSRKVYDITGMNTEEVLLYKKYLHAISLIHTTDFSLTQIAYSSRFSDQSHFIKTFKAFSQITPGQYVINKSHLPGHLYKHVR